MTLIQKQKIKGYFSHLGSVRGYIGYGFLGFFASIRMSFLV
jgi:hypothetical protein